MISSQSFHIFLRVTVVCGVILPVVITSGCELNAPRGLAESEEAAAAYLDIVAYPPGDLPSRTASFEDQAKFAWQEFLALTWKSSYTTTHERGKPDTSWNHSKPLPSGSPVVFETYAHKAELRPWYTKNLVTNFNAAPHYDYGTPPTKGDAGASFTLFNNLDEDNEIGSCYLYGPKVSGEKDATAEFVLYQAKVNQAEYDYVLGTYPPTGTANPPGKDNMGDTKPNVWADLSTAVANTKKNVQNLKVLAYYPGNTTTCDCSDAPEPVICLPCGSAQSVKGSAEGAIEIKAAFRRLTASEASSGRFYQADAIYYQLENGELKYYNGTFGLIGIHIIHKTQNFPDFVFASFEQVDVENSGMQLSENVGSKVPKPGMATSYKRVHPIDPALTEVNDSVQAQLKGLNSDTPWQYYRLIGVQAAVNGQISDCEPFTTTFPQNPPTVSSAGQIVNFDCIQNSQPQDNNYFMANYVIESDNHLGSFNGPGFGSNPYKTINDGANILYEHKTYNTGGCKGCHGVAQTSFGTDLSFLLDTGQGKPTASPDNINNVDDAQRAKVAAGQIPSRVAGQ